MKTWVLMLTIFLMTSLVAIVPAGALADADIALSASRLEISAGTQYTFVTDTGGAPTTWTSSDESVLQIDQSGKAKAIAAGEATVTASAAGGSASCRVTVTAPAIATAADQYNEAKKVFTDTNNQFAMCVAQNNIDTNTNLATISASDSDFYLMRLFLETDGTVPNVTAYHPDTVISGPDHLYVIQFTSVADTQAAYTYLASSAYVYYVVPDRIEQAIDESTMELADTDDFAILDDTTPYALDTGDEDMDVTDVMDDLIDPSAFMILDENTPSAYEFDPEEDSALYSLSAVDTIDPDAFIVFDENTPADALDGEDDSPLDYTYNSWGVAAMKGDDANSRLSLSGSITAAIIDTGISPHVFLGSKLLTGRDYISPGTTPLDEHGHGTHVAGTVVDMSQAFRVYVKAYRVINSSGSGSYVTACLAIRAAADDGCKVINMSLGWPISSYPSAKSAFESAITYATGKGTTFVCSSGNDYSSATYKVPASITVPGTIVTAAVSSSLTRASFSNYGPSVDVAAPGVSIVSCNYKGGYVSMSGTSMATPHAVGAAAIIKLVFPSYSPSQVESYMKSICTDLGSSGRDDYYGYGIPNLSKLPSGSGPETPKQTYPASGLKINYGDTIKFQWTNTGADKYQLILRDQTRGTVHRLNTTGTAYNVKFDAAGNFVWQVRAYASGSWSTSSPRRSFTVKSASGGTPSQIFPAAGYTIKYGDIIQFKWSDTNAQKYKLIIRDKNKGTVYRFNTKGLSYSIKFSIAGNFTWQIRAYNGSSWSALSPKRAFTVKSNSDAVPKQRYPAG